MGSAICGTASCVLVDKPRRPLMLSSKNSVYLKTVRRTKLISTAESRSVLRRLSDVAPPIASASLKLKDTDNSMRITKRGSPHAENRMLAIARKEFFQRAGKAWYASNTTGKNRQRKPMLLKTTVILDVTRF